MVHISHAICKTLNQTDAFPEIADLVMISVPNLLFLQRLPDSTEDS